MSLTQTSLTTRVRTWVLLARYWFSDRIALRAARARPLADGELSGIRSEVRELARLYGIPEPRLFVIPSEQPNAFATGRNPRHSAVAVTEGLVRYLPADQVRGVLAHELAHIRNRDGELGLRLAA